MENDFSILFPGQPGRGQLPGSEVVSYSWGNTGTKDVHDFQFIKHLDVFSPTLMSACAEGRTFDEVVFTARRADGSQAVFFQWKMSKVLISSLELIGASDSEHLPMENYTLHFDELEMEHWTQNVDGSSSPARHTVKKKKAK